MNSHHQIFGAASSHHQMQPQQKPLSPTSLLAATTTNTSTHTNIANNTTSSHTMNSQQLKPLNMVVPPTTHYSEMKSSISSYPFNQPYSMPSTTTTTNNSTSPNPTSSTKMYNNSDSYHGSNYQTSLYSSAVQSNNHPSYTSNATVSSNAANTYTSSMLPQNTNPYQQTYYTSSSFQSSPPSSHHHYTSSQAHVPSNPSSRHSPNSYSTNLQSTPSVTVATSSSVHSMWSSAQQQQEKLPNMKDIFGSPNSTWSPSTSKQQLPSFMDESKKSELPSYNNFNNQNSHSSSTSTTHVSPINSSEHVATAFMEELQQKLRHQDAIIKRLEKENIRLKNELDSFNRSINQYSSSGNSNNMKASSPKKRKIATDATAGTLEMKSQSSHSSISSDQYSNSNEDTSDALDDEDDADEFEDGTDGKSKKRKQPSNLVRSKKAKDEIKKQKPSSSRSSGRRDATVGDLEKYTVTWKGETYVLVNAFKNRTQILNYYVPLYQNNFPEKTCKLVLCNDEYKVLSSENPNTVEKKKHAWRVSVFTMDFYNFVKNFDKRTLKIINSSSGFIPNVNFEGGSVSSPSVPTSSRSNPTQNALPSPMNTSSSTPLLIDNRRPSLPNLQPTLLPPPILSSSTDVNALDMAPKPISTIHNK